MASKYSRLDRFLSQTLGINRKDVRLLLAQGRVFVNDVLARHIQQRIGPFDKVVYDQHVLQAQQAVYLQLHKPKGVVSATTDPQHPTVLDLINGINTTNLHLVGRLDFNTTGLLLLTNDGQWSRYVSQPYSHTPKRYRVWVDKPISDAVITGFAQGVFFDFEGITTQPASLQRLNPKEALVTIHEGKYHQIKRMFGRYQLTVTRLHREAIGSLELDPSLRPGQYRPLSIHEYHSLTPNGSKPLLAET